jgi:hypothetical protein
MSVQPADVALVCVAFMKFAMFANIISPATTPVGLLTVTEAEVLVLVVAVPLGVICALRPVENSILSTITDKASHLGQLFLVNSFCKM